ncbi:MAG: 3-dehydroquinate synthase [Lachnospiraceae bacterium]|nr:3-dehydroquinate synthase [Lachnospiraceae bacterium]
MEKTLNVSYRNSGSYDVVVSDDYTGLTSHIQELFPTLKRICIVSDSNVHKLYAEEVRAALEPCAELIIEYVFNAGEESKTLETVNACYDKLLSNDFNRRDLIVGLGGGVTGDIAAFIASTYMRGCAFVNLPTSLLAMADSSVGGKCGVDYEMYKNIVGSIYMPRLVYAATSVLSSLPDREYSSGMAEVLKAGLIRDAAFYEWLITGFAEIMAKDPDVTGEMIERAVAIKQYYVTKDPFEENERMILNLGHTVGHALEKHFDFKYSHGQCVALGCVAAAYISHKRNMLSDEEFYEIRDMFVPFDLPISLDPFDVDAVCSNIGHDKKNTDTGLKFILLRKIGKGIIVNDVSEDEIKEAVRSLIAEWD